MVNEPKRNSIQHIFINIYNQMFGFDKAYSLKCLASDKQGLSCQNRLWLTWGWSFISLTLTSVWEYIRAQVARRPDTHQYQFNML